MKIFVSWSGGRAYLLGRAIAEWLTSVLPGATPWISTNIPKGSTWMRELTAALDACSVGLLAVTPEVSEDWMCFEAGALCAAEGANPYVVRLSLGLDESALEGSLLARFPGFDATPEGCVKLAARLGSLLDTPTELEEQVSLRMDALRAELLTIPEPPVRDFELILVLPNATLVHRVELVGDGPWLESLKGMVDAMRREEGAQIEDEDWTSFRYLDVIEERWIDIPTHLSSIASPRLALIHPVIAEKWYGNAKVAATLLEQHLDVMPGIARKYREERLTEIERLDSVFLYSFYTWHLANRSLRRDTISDLVGIIRHLEGIPATWRTDALVEILGSMGPADFDKFVEPQLQGIISKVFALARTYRSIIEGTHHIGGAIDHDFFLRMLTQLETELVAVGPPKVTVQAVREALSQLRVADGAAAVDDGIRSLNTAMGPLVAWLRGVPAAAESP